MSDDRMSVQSSEDDRLDALKALNVLDTPSEERFDRITRLASQVFDVPIALVSLVDKERQWFKSVVGLSVCETARDISFCTHAVENREMLVVENALEDVRFKDGPLVQGDPNIRFYAGAPIVLEDGHFLGTLCIIDSKPRTFDEQQRTVLRDMAELVCDSLRDRQRRTRIANDLEKLREADAQIQNHREQLEMAIEGGGLGHWDWDIISGRIQYSEQWAQMVGYRQEELKEEFSTWERLVHENDREPSINIIESYIRGEIPSFEIEFRLQHKDGSWRWIQSRGKVFRSEIDGKPLRMVGTHLDVTEKKKSEISVIEQNRQLHLAESVAEVGHWRIDLINNEIHWSDGIYAIHGVDPATYTPEIVSAIEFYHPDDRPQVEKAVEMAIETQTPFEFELRLIQPSGDVREVHSRAEPLTNEDGEVIAIFGIFQDVTERKRNERMKDEFISTVNHELRTPLTSIFGALDLLRPLAEGRLNEKGMRLIKLAHDSCGRLTRLVNDILDQEKISAGKMEYVLEQTELGELVEQVVESNLGMSMPLRVNLKTDISDEKLHALVDPDRLGQALTNLISNAIKFSPMDADVLIQLNPISDNELRISVTDEGPGISPSFQKKMFERFTQADGSATRKVQGSGLGLNITQSIITAFGGRVTFETEQGEGTTFHLILQRENLDEERVLCLAS